MATFAPDDASVVVIIGSGAGGGTLANELAQKGVNVVLLEADSLDVIRETHASFFLTPKQLIERIENVG